MKIAEFAALINAYAEANPNLLIVGHDVDGEPMALSGLSLLTPQDKEWSDEDGYENFLGDCGELYETESTPEKAKDYHGLTFTWKMV